MYTMQDCTRIGSVKASKGPVAAVASSPSGRLLAVGSKGGLVRLFALDHHRGASVLPAPPPVLQTAINNISAFKI